MTAMTASEVRKTFVDFFVERGHTHHPSASLIPHDPTLLFTVAGMVPFKSYFTGEEAPPFPQGRDSAEMRPGRRQAQRPRRGGPHVQASHFLRDARQLPASGDYFKADAIAWAWELVTEGFGLHPERLWVTVHHSDDEAEQIWHRDVGVPKERIQRLGEDNFWRMADAGPCGPCSEIFWDKGSAYGAPGGPVHGGDDRYVELWNLVFMQFETAVDGTETPLPEPSIDTGLGLERTASVLQGVDSVWETDEFASLLGKAQDLTGVRLGAGERSDVSLRILADHARSMSMLVTDGVFPSNEERGYVLRRIIRRAVRHAWLLGVAEPVMGEMVDATVGVMGGDWPETVREHEHARGVIDREEKRFRETLRVGQSILDERLARLGSGDILSGDAAFLLHDTYGFPLELTMEIAAERGVEVDTGGFAEAMEAQQRRARSARKTVAAGDVSPLVALVAETGATEFTGRAELASRARVLYSAPGEVVLDRTPFYAESGGQIGDTGEIACEATGARVRVVDTVYGVPGLHVHKTEPMSGAGGEADGDGGQQTPAVGGEVIASVDAERRAAIRRSHTGTHILHWALREVLGPHAKQQGSWVGPDRLRFDFSHYEALTEGQRREVEELTNSEVLLNESCRHFETTMDHAEQLGAIAFFGEKYGDVVRVLEAGRHSVELCGGTHVSALGDIGAVRIVSESSIGANMRRVEAVTGMATLRLLRSQHSTLSEAAEALGVPPAELPAAIASRRSEVKSLRNEVAELHRRVALSRSNELAATARDGVVVARVDDADRAVLRDLAVSLRDRDGVDAVVLGSALSAGGVALASAVAAGSGFNAGELISEAKRTIGGGGRPSPGIATAGGRDAGRLDEALDQARAAAGIL